MSRVKQYVCIPITPLFRRVRLPLIGRTFPLWALLAIAAPVVLFASGSAVVYTNQPIFCKSCHEMSMHYATWSQSAHHGVGCEQCHVMPGAMNMFRSKLKALRLVREHAKGDVRATAIQGHVPDANCKHCHPDTPALVTYHGLKITHKAHWDMGTKCTFCHDRVVHGPKWLYTGVTSKERVTAVTTAYKYTPTMETCYTCHDGKQAPNECSTCHVSLGERKPAAFDPAWTAAHREEVNRSKDKEAECARCHSADFCQNCHRSANPHPGDWVARHPAEAKKDAAGCPSCHLAPAERKPKDVTQMAFCAACHSLKREHKQANWTQLHGSEALQTPASCQRCHTQSWCSACHSISRPHPTEWLARHPAEASRNPKNCQTCHTQQFCDACHQSKQSVPDSHKTNWLSHHGQTARKPGSDCSTCHKTDFCQSCHAKKPPASHSALWLSQHGKTSQVEGSSCTLCHEKSFCNSCHGVIMPHPKDWPKQHPKVAAKERKVCAQCHQEEGCTACHRGALPDSHKAAGWATSHGAQAKQSNPQCLLCHREDFCNSCHGLSMPHPQGWKQGVHGKMAESDRSVCLRCHKEKDCTTCHGVTMPHPDDWMGQHGKQAAAAPAKCSTCHQPGHNECTTCHTAISPSSHKSDAWAKGHPVAGASNMDLCVLCHGKDACNSCHAKNAAKMKGN
jgi:nitrate/TMAO reductase-like tetraheme cytochrome c subunit